MSHKVWCCGAEPFVKQVKVAVHGAAPLEDNKAAAGDLVLVDADEAGELDRVSELADSGCKVVVAWRRSGRMTGLVKALQAGAAGVVDKPLHRESLTPYVGAPTSVDADQETDFDLSAWRAEHAPEVVGESEALRDALEVAAQTAAFDCPVLITGESGTGKELMAQAIHRAGERTKRPFIPVNCPAVPKELVESELFGHTKGAFTGATAAREGRFSAADGGTLFLDEIGEMEPSIQSKLLRVLQDYQITPVGESRPRQVDVRIIAATNRDLEQEIEGGSFREDLYYRLNVIQIHLPPLRERREDVPLLIERLLAKLASERKVQAPKLNDAAREALFGYDWPGNIRQLRNVIERLVILRHGRTVEVKHLPPQVTRDQQATDQGSSFGANAELPKEGIDLRDALQRFEEQMIRKALLTTEGNKNQAAKLLGLNRTTLVEKLRKRPIEIAA